MGSNSTANIVCGYPLLAGQTSTGLTQWQERYLKGIPGINKFAAGYDHLTGEEKLVSNGC